MTTPSSIDIVSEYTKALAAADFEQMNSLRSKDFVLDFVHNDASEAGPADAAFIETFWPAWMAGFPDYDYEAVRTIAAEAVVVTQWTFLGTHAEPLGPPIFESTQEPTGRTIRLRGVSVYDTGDGLIQRETLYMDFATLMVELDVEP